MGPLNRLTAKYSTDSVESSPRSEGMVPVKRLEVKKHWESEERALTYDWMDPVDMF